MNQGKDRRPAPIFLVGMLIFLFFFIAMIETKIIPEYSVFTGYFIVTSAVCTVIGLMISLAGIGWKGSLIALGIAGLILYFPMEAAIMGIPISSMDINLLAIIIGGIGLLFMYTIASGGGRGGGGGGTSTEEKGKMTEYYDRDGRYIGFSVREGARIVYYDKDGKYVGESKSEGEHPLRREREEKRPSGRA